MGLTVIDSYTAQVFLFYGPNMTNRTPKERIALEKYHSKYLDRLKKMNRELV